MAEKLAQIGKRETVEFVMKIRKSMHENRRVGWTGFIVFNGLFRFTVRTFIV